MNIVHCFFSLRVGGSEVLAIDMINEMCKNHDVSLIVVNNQWNKMLLKQLNAKAKVYLINRREGSRNPIPILRFNLLLKRIRPDVVHCHEDKLVNLIKFGHYKTVYTVHDVGLDNSAITKYERVIAISASVANDIYSRFNLKAKVIYNGITMHNFKKRDGYIIDTGQPVKLVQISRLVHEKKGQDILIVALHKIINDYKITNIFLDLIGTGPSLEFLETLVKRLDLTGYVNFLGEKDRSWIVNNLSGYHALVQPSKYEGFGLTIVEGIAAGIPVAASNIDGPAEIMADSKIKFLFENGNADDCARSLLSLINYYRQGMMELIVDDMYNKIKHRFSLQSTVEQYLQIY